MKFISWILVLLPIPVGLFLSFFSYLSHGLGLLFTSFGEAVAIMGVLSFVVCAVCTVLGIIKLRKGNVKKAIACALVALSYCVAIVAGFFIDETVDYIRYKERIANRNVELYGENWDAPPAIGGIPELYQEVLNKYYAVVRDKWPADQLMDLGAVSMADYYGDESLDNIGFTLMDLNGDNVDELVIGAVAHAEKLGNEIFCIYSNPENPHYSINAVKGEVYYLHSGAGDGSYELEIAGTDRTWVIKTAQSENTFDFNPREGTMDPAGRVTLPMIPFSQYK